MHASEPKLLYILLIIVWCTEQVLPKERPAFINRYRLSHDFEVRVVDGLRAREVRNVVYPAHRPDCVPDSNEIRLTFAAKGFLEVGSHREVYLLALEHPNRVRD